MTFEEWLSEKLDKKSINLSKLAINTGISYQALYSSLYDKKKNRELRSHELIAICRNIGVNPMQYDKEARL